MYVLHDTRRLYVHAKCLGGCSDAVQVLAQKQLENLYGRQAKQPGFQYLAVHLRLGGMENEAKLLMTKGSGSGPVTDLAHSITCIKNLGEHLGLSYLGFGGDDLGLPVCFCRVVPPHGQCHPRNGAHEHTDKRQLTAVSKSGT
jgi:hypothetical protein